MPDPTPLPFPVPPSMRARALPVALALWFCAGFADGAMVPFFPLWARDAAGIPVALVGVLFGLYAGGELLATPLSGGIADRRGRRPVLACCALGVGTAFCLLGLARGAWQAAAVLLAAGMFEAALHPTIAAVIGDVTVEQDRTRGFAWGRMASGAGGLLGPAAGALVAARWGTAAVFPVAGAMLLGGGIAVLPMPETRGADRDDADAEEDGEEGLGALMPAFRDRWMAALLGRMLLLELAGSGVEAVLPLWAHDRVGMRAGAVGWLFAAAAGFGLAGQLPLSRLAARWTRARTMRVAAALTAAGFQVLWCWREPAGLLVALLACEAGGMLSGPMLMAAVGGAATPGKRAATMAAASMVHDVQDSLGPATGTALYAMAAGAPWLLGIPAVLGAGRGLARVLERSERSDGGDRGGAVGPAGDGAAAGDRENGTGAGPTEQARLPGA